ncbi:hypothetical protein [Flavobacterium sp.]|uniref:hypothetical protein n=1 Tax=Flavobacterium sp. TaxID=239 RepID=UPI0008C78D53|nr:hypothetical protein [Flavobacterium sp.]OGS63425.1 MAG: hypothetical protein A2X07_05355 [Flavobacteria bacterium GWF1_32_7]HBD27217.1 hypothetical protein [Flavobacterium sp.]
MKKVLLLLILVGNVAFAQKLTKDQLSDKLAESACACTEKQELTKENFELTIGICLIEGINAYEKDVEKHYGKNVISNDKKMEELATNIGARMGLKCPAVFKFMLDEETGDAEEVADAEELTISGKISEIKSEQFITFIVKEDSGKNNQFILLSSFDNAFLLTDKVLKASDAVDVVYYEMELFDAKLGKFVSYKIVTDIIKK